MSYRHRPVIMHNLIWLSMLSMGGLVSARGACYNTPAAAAYSMKQDSSASTTIEGGGYRVTSIEADPVSGQRWAMISSCDHPERPAFSLQIERSDSPEHSLPSEPQSARPIPVIHVGDNVRLWRQEASLRIELAAVAEENGSLGKLIRVRLLRRNTDDQSIPAEFNGIVRGKSDVEMQP
jgi:hypothetical protein